MTNAVLDAENADASWKSLYKVGGAAALVHVLITVAQFVVFMVAPPPETVIGWFGLFQDNALLGLLASEFLLVIYVIVSIPVTLALYMALRRASPSWTAIFLALSLVGVVALITARPGFEMLSLSNQHAAATTDEQRSLLLAAGEATLAVFEGTAFQVSYVLGSISGLIIAAVMLRSAVFGKVTAYLRLMSGVLDFGIFVPVIGLYISMFSVIFLLIFNILIARRLFQLGAGVRLAQANQKETPGQMQGQMTGT